MNAQLSKRLRLLASAVSVLALLAVLALGWGYARVRASLPMLDGRAAIPGLSGPATVERDNLGVPTIRAQNRADAARALGFLHAQDRFFQMDTLRRAAAGELSEEFGLMTLPRDRAMRMHGFRRQAQASLARLPADQRALIEAYAAGVNAGLAALGARPFEYLVIRGTPQPWKPEDTLLVAYAMLLDLQDGTGTYEQSLTTLRDQLGAPGVAFFAPLLTPADAALDGTTGPVADIPGPQVLNLRAKTAGSVTPEASAAASVAVRTVTPDADLLGPLGRDPDAVPGSNAFALSGAHTKTGAAMVAGDMHLGLRVPNVWYRASLEFPGHRITGVTLPGVPVVIAGSNGKVAWSFTNSYADTGDLVMFDVNPVAPSLYRAPGRTDLLEIERRHESIGIKGHKPEERDYEWTIWGPIVNRDDKGRAYAYLWTGHDPDATNLNLLRMEDAATVADGVRVAHESGIPTQNLVIADAQGDIAWTIAGRLPRRVGYSGRLPVTFQFGDREWRGPVPAGEIPAVTTKPVRPGADLAAPDGRIWSANQRMLGGDALTVLGDGGYARPNRAAQIRDDLARLEHAAPADLLAVQLDDRALFLEPWHALLLATLSPGATAENQDRAKLRGYVEKWEGRASVEAVSYPVAKLFRIAVYTRVFTPIFASCKEANPNFKWSNFLLEGAVWRLLKDRPAHLLDPSYASWDALLVAAVDDTITELNRGGVRLPYATWGKRNTAEIRHPFSYTLPWFFRSWLDMPRTPLPGDVDMPRVQTPTHGASERFVVSPGHEDEGIFEMPCGQSGHPMSRYYRAGHSAWERGEPTPFLPGKTEHTLTLEPAAATER